MSCRRSRSESPNLSRAGSPKSRTSASGNVSCSPEQRLGHSSGSQTIASDSKCQERTHVVIKTGAVVIDTGTGTCKAGFAGQQTPQAVMRTVVGYPTERSTRTMRDRPDAFIGGQARLEPEVDIILPLWNGTIVDWEAVEVLWRHLFCHKLKVAPEDYALLLSDPPLCPTTNREKLAEVAFESLNSPGMYVAYQSVLSAYRHGKITGLVVDTGYAVTHTVPVYQGYNLPHATERMDVAGADMTSFLMDLLKDNGYQFEERALAIVEDMKEKCCYVALDFEAEWSRPKVEYTVDYQLPDGKAIKLGNERFLCPEILFHPPQMSGLSLLGLDSMAHESVRKVEEPHRREMYGNIMLCGGSSLFEGFEKRFTSDLLAVVPADTKVNVTAMPHRKYSVWIGGSILASLGSFQEVWIRKEQYQEHGPNIVHRKCY